MSSRSRNEPGEETGIYIAYPTSPILKSIYQVKNYRTQVNHQHTKVGIAKGSFSARKKGYVKNFDEEVDFIPIAIIDYEYLKYAETRVILAVSSEFSKVGRAQEWFNTSDRQRISEIIAHTLMSSDIEHLFVG